ncbi:hypothetical protein Tco_0070677 [Tanacetum coccineum]
MEQMKSICDMVGQIMQKKEEERRIAEDQAAKDQYWKIPICYDDDEDYTIALNKQTCVLSDYSWLIQPVEVFMADFSVFGNSFDNCLNNLDKMLQRCKDANVVLTWEKCHFMVKEGIVLGYKVSRAGLEVDKAKINVISKLPPPTNVKGH